MGDLNEYIYTVDPRFNVPRSNENLAPTLKFSCTEVISTKLTSVQREPRWPLQRAHFIETKPQFNEKNVTSMNFI